MHRQTDRHSSKHSRWCTASVYCGSQWWWRHKEENSKLMGGVCLSGRLPALRRLETRCQGLSVTCLLATTPSDEWNKSLRPHPVLRLSFQSVFSSCLRWSSSLFASTSLFPPEPRGKDSRFLRCRVRGRKESSGRREVGGGGCSAQYPTGAHCCDTSNGLQCGVHTEVQ